jgi:phage gp29-like protein
MSIIKKLKSLFRPSSHRLLSEFDTPQKRAEFFSAIISNILENPDEILARYAPSEGINLYRKMESADPVVASALTTRKSAVLNRPWMILRSGADEEIHRFVLDMFEQLTDFRRTLTDAMSALVTGFVPLEILWHVKQDRWLPEKIIARDPANYVFDQNSQLRLLTKNHPIEGECVSPYKFIIHTHNASSINPYGVSILKPLYWPVTFSRAGWKWWATAIEKYGMPIITASFPNESSTEDRSRFEDFVRSLQSYSWSVVPEGFSVELHEAKRAAGADYLPFLQYADTKKFQVILGQNLTAETSDHGSRAQADVHNQVRNDLTLADSTALADTFSDQLIKLAVSLNFNYSGPTPKFAITPSPAHDLEKLARTYDILAKHIAIPDHFLRQTFQITE